MTQRMTAEQKEVYLRALQDVEDLIRGHVQNMDSRHDAGAIAHIESLLEAVNDLRYTE